MGQYPEGAEAEPYPGFLDDSLNTLGRCIMDRTCWSDGGIVVGEILHHGVWPSGRRGWRNASGDFSASMFFCLKYLTADRIDGWLNAVLAITCPHWRAQVIVWFVAAHDILTGKSGVPTTFRKDGVPNIYWGGTEFLHVERKEIDEMRNFLPEASRKQAIETVKSVTSEAKIAAWMRGIAAFDYLGTELGDLPERFVRLYLSEDRVG